MDTDSTQPSSDSIKRQLLLEEYKTLRSEIEQSIKHQHQITLSGYAAAIAIMGSGAKGELAAVAYLIPPYVLLVMAALWAAECNRMVRAGYYIGFYIWPALSSPHVGDANWEAWVRRDKKTMFGAAQHWYQTLFVFGVPLVASLMASVYLFFQYLDCVIPLAIAIGYVVPLLLWFPLWHKAQMVSNLARLTPDGVEVAHF